MGRQAEDMIATELFPIIRGLKQLSAHSYPLNFGFTFSNLLQKIR